MMHLIFFWPREAELDNHVIVREKNVLENSIEHCNNLSRPRIVDI